MSFWPSLSVETCPGNPHEPRNGNSLTAHNLCWFSKNLLSVPRATSFGPILARLSRLTESSQSQGDQNTFCHCGAVHWTSSSVCRKCLHLQNFDKAGFDRTDCAGSWNFAPTEQDSHSILKNLESKRSQDLKRERGNIQEFRPDRSAMQRHCGLRLFFKKYSTYTTVPYCTVHGL